MVTRYYYYFNICNDAYLEYITLHITLYIYIYVYIQERIQGGGLGDSPPPLNFFPTLRGSGGGT